MYIYIFVVSKYWVNQNIRWCFVWKSKYHMAGNRWFRITVHENLRQCFRCFNQVLCKRTRLPKTCPKQVRQNTCRIGVSGHHDASTANWNMNMKQLACNPSHPPGHIFPMGKTSKNHCNHLSHTLQKCSKSLSSTCGWQFRLYIHWKKHIICIWYYVWYVALFDSHSLHLTGQNTKIGIGSQLVQSHPWPRWKCGNGELKQDVQCTYTRVICLIEHSQNEFTIGKTVGFRGHHFWCTSPQVHFGDYILPTNYPPQRNWEGEKMESSKYSPV